MRLVVICHRGCGSCQILRLGGLKLQLTSLTGNENKSNCFAFGRVASFRYLPEWDSGHFKHACTLSWAHARTHFTVKHVADTSRRHQVAWERETTTVLGTQNVIMMDFTYLSSLFFFRWTQDVSSELSSRWMHKINWKIHHLGSKRKHFPYDSSLKVHSNV